MFWKTFEPIWTSCPHSGFLEIGKAVKHVFLRELRETGITGEKPCRNKCNHRKARDGIKTAF